jgi:hypothetical protein
VAHKDINVVVNSNTNITGSISQGKTAAVTRVTVPGPKGDAGEEATSLRLLSDVDASTLQDGALIQYDAGTDSFTTRNVIETETGELRLTGGIF